LGNKFNLNKVKPLSDANVRIGSNNFLGKQRNPITPLKSFNKGNSANLKSNATVTSKNMNNKRVNHSNVNGGFSYKRPNLNTNPLSDANVRIGSNNFLGKQRNPITPLKPSYKGNSANLQNKKSDNVTATRLVRCN